jgi:iron-sulfur cluster assembly accessory protein
MEMAMTVQDQSGVTASTVEATTHSVVLTDAAAAKVKSLLGQEGRDDLRLRVAVQPGGCSGWCISSASTSDPRRRRDQGLRRYRGGRRPTSVHLGGATVDFADTIEKQGFTIDNPNTQGGCACGDSFC